METWADDDDILRHFDGYGQRIRRREAGAREVGGEDDLRDRLIPRGRELARAQWLADKVVDAISFVAMIGACAGLVMLILVLSGWRF